MIAKDLEVCIIHCNERVVELCRASLRQQTLQPARIYEVVNVRPVTKAYNEYHRKMKLDYVVHVDADTLLYPFALEKLYTEFKKLDHDKYYCMIGFCKDVVAGRVAGVRITRVSPEIKSVTVPADSAGCDRTEKQIMRNLYNKHYAHIEDEVALHLSNWNGIESLVSSFYHRGQKVATFGDQKLRLLKQIAVSWTDTGNIEPLIAMISFCHGLFSINEKAKEIGHGRKVANAIKRMVYKQRVIYYMGKKRYVEKG